MTDRRALTDDELDDMEARATIWVPDTSVAADFARDSVALVAEVRFLRRDVAQMEARLRSSYRRSGC